MKPIIVIETSGKRECTDFAVIYLFDSKDAAQAFCKARNTGKMKYWTKAEIVDVGEQIDLGQPYEE